MTSCKKIWHGQLLPARRASHSTVPFLQFPPKATPSPSAAGSRGPSEKFHCTMLIQRINLHRARGKDQVKTGGYVSNNCHIADTWQDWSCSSKSVAELCFGGFDFMPTVGNYNVPPYLKIIFERGLLTSGLVSMLRQARAAAFKPLSLQSSSPPTRTDSHSKAVATQVPLTPWLWHFLCRTGTQTLAFPRLSSRFWRKAATGHSVCTCNPAQAFPPLQMLLLLMLVSHFLHHLLFLQLSQLPIL